MSLEQYGFVVAADALGQLIFSPIFGLIADRMDSIRMVSLICCLTFCIGNALYANVALVPADLFGDDVQTRMYAMLFARFVVGKDYLDRMAKYQLKPSWRTIIDENWNTFSMYHLVRFLM